MRNKLFHLLLVTTCFCWAAHASEEWDEEEFVEDDDEFEEVLAEEEDEVFEEFLAEDEGDLPDGQYIEGSGATVKRSYPFLLEVKAGYFFFASHRMRAIYSKGGTDLQISGAWTFWRPLQLYASLEYLWLSGKSVNGDERTHFRAIPLSLGLRYLVPICERFDYYLTLGPRYTFAWIKNHSSFVDRNIHDSGFGGFLNTGFFYRVTPHFIVDLFGEYAYQRISFHSSRHHVTGHSIQVGGFTFGAGLGYAF